MKQRNYGIDLLRITSMFMIVMLHVLGQGGLLHSLPVNTFSYWIAWSMETASFCAVNCYALISGYVMWGSAAKLSRIFELWLQVAFYTISIAVIFFIALPETYNQTRLLSAIFPVSHKQLWYISAYFGLYIFTPLLNTAIQNTPKQTFKKVLVVAFIMISVLPTIFKTDPYALSGGYSFAWLVLLYFVGGYIGKYNVFEKTKKRVAFLIFVLSVAFSVLAKFLLWRMELKGIENINANMFISYTSPTIITAALAALAFCLKLNLSKGAVKLIAFFSPAMLGIYIIHVSYFPWRYIIKDFAVPFAKMGAVKMTAMCIFSAIFIFTVCAFIEILRIQLFKLIRVKALCIKLEGKFQKN